jgi:predicted PurR-regulated permease PerM
MTKGKQILFYSTLSVVGIYFLFLGIHDAKGFLSPFLTAIILALVVLPLSKKLERNHIKRSYTSLINTFLLFLLSLGFLALLSLQVRSFISDWPKIEETMTPKVEQFKGFVFDHTPLTKGDLEQSDSGSGIPFLSSGSNRGKQAISFFSKSIGFIGTYLLTFIYIFFLLNYRKRFKVFLLKLFPEEKKQQVKEVVHKSAEVAQDYLLGKLILIGLLAVVYSIGLGISGVSNFILVSIIAALLTLIPYIGNIIGLSLAMAFGYLTSGELGVLIGVLITFTVSQFLESYVLQPYVVGDKVDLHPFTVIVVVVLGGALWGVIGMILAIPVMAIIAVIFQHIPPLQAFGFLFSRKKSSD